MDTNNNKEIVADVIHNGHKGLEVVLGIATGYAIGRTVEFGMTKLFPKAKSVVVGTKIKRFTSRYKNKKDDEEPTIIVKEKNIGTIKNEE